MDYQKKSYHFTCENCKRTRDKDEENIQMDEIKSPIENYSNQKGRQRLPTNQDSPEKACTNKVQYTNTVKFIL